MSSIEDCLSRLESSAASISALPFTSTRRFSHAILSPSAHFESRCLREAEAHELSLFQPASHLNAVRAAEGLSRGSGSGSGSGGRSLAPVGQGAPWPAPSPLKKSRAKGTGADDHAAAQEAQRLLLAAERLLQIYPMKRASSHVDALKHRLTQLQEAIDQDQEYLSSTQDSSNPFTARQPITDQHIQDLQDSLKREELELIALRVAHEERLQHKQKEKQRVSAQQENKRAQQQQQQAEREHATQAEAREQQQRRETEDEERKAAEDEQAEKLRAQKEAIPVLPPVVSETPSPAASAPAPVVDKPFSTELLDRIAAKVTAVLKDPMAVVSSAAAAPSEPRFESVLASLAVLPDSGAADALNSIPALQQAELYLLYIFLLALAQPDHPPPNTPLLTLHVLDRPQAMLALDSSRLFCTPDGRIGLVSMAEAKAAVSTWATDQRDFGAEWQGGEMPTKALYGLVAKGLLKIDRRTVKDPRVYFDPSAVA